MADFLFWFAVVGILVGPFIWLIMARIRLSRDPTNSRARASVGYSIWLIFFGGLWIGLTAFFGWLVHGVLGISTPAGSFPRKLVSVFIFCTPLVLLVCLSVDLRRYAGRIFSPLRQAGRMLHIGQGGSAAFAGLWDEWAAKYQPGDILLGYSLYDPDWLVGHSDDRGVLTIAASRSGKGRSAIIPNLLMWPGSALVIDPKGTNAAVTRERRGFGNYRIKEAMGQAVHVVDPFGLVVTKAGSAQFNPLAAIDLKSSRVVEDISLIADALVVPTGYEDSHWDEGARTIIKGLIAHLVSRNPKATLVDVRKALNQNLERLDALFEEMMENEAAGGLAISAATFLAKAGPNERGSFFTTVMRNLGWLDSLAMQHALSGSSFDMRALKTRPMTVYIVLPPELLQVHSRFLRLFVNLAIRAMSQGGKSQYPVLFLLDEFYSLGKLSVLESAAGLLSGYGMKLWPIVQNIGQLQHLYPKNWETFFANAGIVQVFSVNDLATAEYLVNRLGKRSRNVRVGNNIIRAIESLREIEEVGRDTAREKQRQIIFRSGDDPLVLGRVQYDYYFPTWMYADDPDYPSPDSVAIRGDIAGRFNLIVEILQSLGVTEVPALEWVKARLPFLNRKQIGMKPPPLKSGPEKPKGALPPPAPPIKPAPKPIAPPQKPVAEKPPAQIVSPPPETKKPPALAAGSEFAQLLKKYDEACLEEPGEFERRSEELRRLAGNDAAKLDAYTNWERSLGVKLDFKKWMVDKLQQRKSAKGATDGAKQVDAGTGAARTDRPRSDDPGNPWKGWKRPAQQEIAERKKRPPRKRKKKGGGKNSKPGETHDEP